MRGVLYAPAVRRALPWPYAERLLFAAIRVRFSIRLVSSPPKTDVSVVRLPYPYTGLAQRKSSLFAAVREETAHGNAARREVRILTTDLSRLKTLKNRCAPAILHANPLCRIAAPNLPAGPGIPPGGRLSHPIFCGEWARARCRSAEPPTAGKARGTPTIQLIF